MSTTGLTYSLGGESSILGRKPVLLPVATRDDGGTVQVTHLGELAKITIDSALPDPEDRCDSGRTHPGFGQLLGESATQVDTKSQQLIAKTIMDIGIPGVIAEGLMDLARVRLDDQRENGFVRGLDRFPRGAHRVEFRCDQRDDLFGLGRGHRSGL
jgi:hypothetical protein